jgi:uncharacterized protein YcaQ
MTVYPLSAARALALETQCLTLPNGIEPTPTLDSVFETINTLGAVQIDTLQMVARSHYIAIWSRHGSYDPKLFDRLAYDATERKVFEGWQHAACFIPLQEYRYQIPRQRSLQGITNGYTRWLALLQQPEIVEVVRARIAQEGALKISDFERGDHPGGTWWNWRPAKIALEYLFASGELMVSERKSFQRVYDQTERVLPEWAERNEVSAAERDRFWVERGAKALGICTPAQAADYTWMKPGIGKPMAAELVKAGVLVEVQVRLQDNETYTFMVHKDNLRLLQKAADGTILPQRTTFLSPFDSLFWARGRDEALWGFRQRLEAYYPAPKRVYGYFCLPILHKDRLVGRLDPKLERKDGILRLKALYLEPGVEPDDDLVGGVATAMRDFMTFHKAKDLLIEKSQPEPFGEKLMKSL